MKHAKKTKTQRLTPEATGAWETVAGPHNDGGTIAKRMPRQRVPAIARKGMVVSIYSRSENHAVLVELTPTVAICRTERGELIAMYWNEVELADVQPDPAALAPATSERRLR